MEQPILSTAVFGTILISGCTGFFVLFLFYFVLFLFLFIYLFFLLKDTYKLGGIC